MAFALFHLALLLAVLVWAVLSLLHGNVLRFLLILAALAAYYFLALHANVKKEIARTRQQKP